MCASRWWPMSRTSATQANCSSCRFFAERIFGNKVMRRPATGEALGDCRLHAPRVVKSGGSVSTQFPSVWGNDWCGDYQEAKALEAPHPPTEDEWRDLGRPEGE